MLPRPKKKAVLITAAAVGVGLAGIVAIPFGADASLVNALSATNGSTQIELHPGTAVPTRDPIYYGSWAPDSSRLVYVDSGGGGGNLRTVRYNDGNNVVDLVNSNDTVTYPVYSPNGVYVYYADQALDMPATIQAVSYGYDPALVVGDDDFDYGHPSTGIDSNFTTKLVFEKRAWTWVNPADHSQGGSSVTATPEIWGYTDDAQTDPVLVVADASSPAIDVHGTELAFVRPDAGNHRQIFVANLDGSNVTQLTTDPVDHDNPAWSRDDASIAFNVGQGGSVYTMDANGAHVTLITGMTGLPAYAPGETDTALRVGGSNRYATANLTSGLYWETANGDPTDPYQAKSVVLSRSDTFADALGGAALAAAKQGPLLLTDPVTLTPATATEIQRVLGTDTAKTVYLLGGTGAISDAEETQIKAMGYDVQRISGNDRFATSVAIANAINPHPSFVLAATGMNFPDALGAGAAAGSYDVPGNGSPYSAVVVLTNDTTMPVATKAYLDAQVAYAAAQPKPVAMPIYGIGVQASTAIAGYDNAYEIAGSNRYGTSRAVAEVFFGSQYVAGVATGLNWPDALAGGALMGTLNGPILLAGPNGIDANIAAVFNETSPSTSLAFVFGASPVISDATLNQVATQISGPQAPTVQVTSPSIAPAGRTLNRTTGGPTVGAKPGGSSISRTHRTLTQITDSAKALQK